MTRPLSARLVLLAAAAALAGFLVLAMVMAEHRDRDGVPPSGAAAVQELRVAAPARSAP